MKHLPTAFILITLLALALVGTASAEHGLPIAGCPDNYELHHAMDHDDHHEGEHLHVGSDTDLNGDGWLCVKHFSASGGVHVHMDNWVPLPKSR